MKIETLPGGARLVKRYRKGYCYAAVWSADRTDKQIARDIATGEAAFFPFNESTGQFDWSRGNGRPLRIRSGHSAF